MCLIHVPINLRYLTLIFSFRSQSMWLWCLGSVTLIILTIISLRRSFITSRGCLSVVTLVVNSHDYSTCLFLSPVSILSSMSSFKYFLNLVVMRPLLVTMSYSRMGWSSAPVFVFFNNGRFSIEFSLRFDPGYNLIPDVYSISNFKVSCGGRLLPLNQVTSQDLLHFSRSVSSASTR